MVFLLFSCTGKDKSENGAQTENAEKSVIVKVLSENGMILREKPDRKSGKLAAIPWGTEVEMTDANGPFEIIDDVSGKWVKIVYDGKTGWVFGGFLAMKVGSDFVNLTNNIDVFIESGFNLDIKWESGKDEIIAKLGEPLKTETSSFVFQADGKEYAKYLLKYRNYSIEVLDIPNNNIINSIEIFSPEHVNLFNMKTGANINALMKIIGEPSEIEKNVINGKEYLIYQFIPIDNNLFQGLDVYTIKGRISKIIWYRAVE